MAYWGQSTSSVTQSVWERLLSIVTWYTFTLTRLKNSANRKRTCNPKHKIRSGCSNSSIRNRPQSEIAPLVCHRYTYTAKVINPVLPSLNLATWYCANNPAHTLDQSVSLPPFTHTSHHWPAAPHMKSCLQSHELPSKDQTKQKTCLFLAQVNRKRTLPLYIINTIPTKSWLPRAAQAVHVSHFQMPQEAKNCARTALMCSEDTTPRPLLVSVLIKTTLIRTIAGFHIGRVCPGILPPAEKILFETLHRYSKPSATNDTASPFSHWLVRLQ